MKGLVALQSIANDAMKGSELPKRLKLLNWGDNETTKGNVRVGPETVKALAANQLKYGFDRIALDFNHNSLPGHANFKPDPREVAAYGVPTVIENDGLYLESIAYTPSGEKFAREYHDLSPTPRLNAKGEVDFLHSVALCPQGAVKGLSFFNSDFLETQASDMNFKKLLCTLLGLSVDASETEIQTAAEAFAKDEKKTETEKPTALSAEAAKEVADLVKTVNALSEKLDAQERHALLADAARDGKLVPVNSAKSLPLADLKALVAELPAGQVPLSQRTPEHLQALAASGLNPGNAVDDAVCKQLGITKEDWAK